MINLLIIFALVVVATYWMVITGMIYGMTRIKSTKQYPSCKMLTVIVPLRNEEENIRQLVKSIAGQSYPSAMFKVVFVNDHSTDDTVIEVRKAITGIAKMKILENTGHGKKEAVKTGVENSTTEYIVTTDADCLHAENWLWEINNALSANSPDMLVLPVIVQHGNDFYTSAQGMEQLSLQGITAGSIGLGYPIMASGANMVIKREAFLELKDFQLREIIVGDDTFLLHEMVRNKMKISCYSHDDLIVKTKSNTSIKTLVIQRIRWAQKTANYQLLLPKFIAWLVTLLCIIIIVYPFLWAIHLNLFYIGLLCFGIKATIDFLFLFLVSSHFGKKELLPIYPVVAMLYVPYAVIVPLLSVFVKRKWKDRTI